MSDLNDLSWEQEFQAFLDGLSGPTVPPILDLESTIGQLKLHNCQLPCQEESRVALRRLNANPQIPGVLLTQDGDFRGMISRRRLLEQMSRPYGLDLFLQRSLFQLYQYAQIPHLILPQNTLITEAAEKAIMRPGELLDEPIIVELEKHQYQLLDIHQLLIGQSSIFQLTTRLFEQSNRQLQKLAVIDPLTRIGNRRMFEQYFSRDWYHAIREQKWISLIICDVDYFKKYNDTYGHPQGDRCLRQVAQILRSNCKRATDIVARYGGEEFVIVLLDTKPSNAIEMVEKIQQSLMSCNLLHSASEVSSQVTLSFGVASARPKAATQEQTLIDLADQALYQAKQAGRNRYVLLKA
ncbi:GGDEF domain-containing protein [Synechocystis sp. LKSZ1]|uniref:GGDEF domain-containing protein n=1 Tax=Synechocystis sp. LKSZ1 TaxID=3144951 RepID=UPI00336C0C80